jgi:hypothetical protein
MKNMLKCVRTYTRAAEAMIGLGRAELTASRRASSGTGRSADVLICAGMGPMQSSFRRPMDKRRNLVYLH